MSVSLLPAIEAALSAIESTGCYINGRGFSVELERLIPDAGALSESERRGCVAEIIGHRFATMPSDEREPWGSYFGPVTSGVDQAGNPVYFPDATKVDDEVIDYWRSRSESSSHPILRARYADLAWEISRIWNRSHPDDPRFALPREVAQRASSAYMDSVKLLDPATPSQMHEAWQFLGRAISLALSVKAQSLVDRAKSVAFEFNRANHRSGLFSQWWQIDDFAFERKGLALSDAERVEILAWLQGALEAFADVADPKRFDPHHALQAADRLARWAGKLKKPELGVDALRKAGAAFEEFAKCSNAMTAIAWLEDLSVRYRDNGLALDASRVDAAIIERSDEARRSMKRSSVEIDVSDEDMEAWLAALMEGSARLALGRVAFNLVSQPESLRRQISEIAANAPLHARISINLVDDHGFIAATIGSVADDIDGRMVNAAATHIGASSPWLHQALKRLDAQWGIGPKSLLDILGRSHLFPPRAHALLRAGLEAWGEGDHVKAVHVLVPQVEAGLREMLRAYGESPMRRNDREGGFESIGMGALLTNPVFKEKAHPAFRLHLRALYTSPKGVNLRNRVAHGLANNDVFDLGMANWVVHTLLAILTFGHLNSTT